MEILYISSRLITLLMWVAVNILPIILRSGIESTFFIPVLPHLTNPTFLSKRKYDMQTNTNEAVYRDKSGQDDVGWFGLTRLDWKMYFAVV